jgi:integrase/recombinase XerD
LKKHNSKVKNAQQLRASVNAKWSKRYNLREVQYKEGHRYIGSTEAFLVNETEGLSEEVSKFHPLR